MGLSVVSYEGEVVHNLEENCRVNTSFADDFNAIYTHELKSTGIKSKHILLSNRVKFLSISAWVFKCCS